MWKRKAAPVIPVPDRRQRRRIFTLRNFRNAGLIALGLLVVINVFSEIRKPRDSDFGRILRKALPAETPARPVEVVKETQPVDEQYGADPMLLEPAARAQYLGDTTLEPLSTPYGSTVTAGALTTMTPDQAGASLSDKSKVAVVGGPEGLAVVQQERRPLPKLGGGFGKE